MLAFEAAKVFIAWNHWRILQFVFFVPGNKALVSCNLVSCCLKIIAWS